MPYLLTSVLVPSLLIILAACSTTPQVVKSPETARQELEKMSIPFTSDEFVRRATDDDTATIQLFLDANMNPDSEGQYGRTALILAAQTCKTNVIRLLLENGASVNPKDENETTALGHAASSCETGTIRALIMNGVDIFQEEDLANAAFVLAHTIPNVTPDEVKGRLICWFCGDLEPLMREALKDKDEWLTVLRLLKEGGGNTLQEYGMTDLMWASTQYDAVAVKKLLENGAEPDAKDELDWTALIFAVNHGDIETVTTLLDYGADPNIEYQWGGPMTALQFAELFGLTEIVALLKGARAGE